MCEMKTRLVKAFVSVFFCASTALALGSDTAERKEIDAQIELLRKSRASYREIVEFLERRLAAGSAKTNAQLRVFIDRKILSFCSMPSWTQFSLWDKKWSDGKIPSLCEREIAASDCPSAEKLDFLRALSRHQAGVKDYASSLATAQKALHLEGLKPRDLFEAHCLVADACRWADRYDDAKKAYRKAAKFNGVEAAKMMADLAVDYGRQSDIADAWADVDDSYPRLLWCVGRDVPGAADEAFKYIEDEKNPVKNRRDILARYFGAEKSERGERSRQIAAKLDYAGYFNWDVFGRFTRVYRFGDWALFVKIAEAFKTMAWFNDPGRYRAYLFSLVAVGRSSDAAEFSRRFVAADAAREKPALTPLERVKFEMIGALAEKRDLAEVARAAGLAPRQYGEALLTAAQWTLNLRRNEECERYSAMYRALFKDAPARSYPVRFFERPVSSIAAWRGIADTLEKSYVDVRMCGELDSLETDVATGRAVVEKTSLDADDARMEITSFCDVEGLKIVMRVVDGNARAVENGFAGGIATECYFAPGEGEPYICFSSAPREGVGFVFYTAYSSAYSERVEFGDGRSPLAIRQEREFSDGDYVLMITLPWRAFYQKLPARPATRWRFECLADGYSWGGSQGVHESSSWGDLVFDLKPSEISAIRRRLIYDTCKDFNSAPHGELSAFARWSDPVVGDSEFYESVLKPLEEKLVRQAKRVSGKMSGLEVDDIYENGAKIWLGLDHEIDALRRNWLLEKFAGSR